MHLNDHQALGISIVTSPAVARRRCQVRPQACHSPSRGQPTLRPSRSCSRSSLRRSDHVPHLQLPTSSWPQHRGGCGRKSGLDLAPLLNQLAHQNSCGGTCWCWRRVCGRRSCTTSPLGLRRNTYWKVGAQHRLSAASPGWSYATDEVSTHSTRPRARPRDEALSVTWSVGTHFMILSVSVAGQASA